MTDPRMDKAKELLARRSATLREILEMSFGEWPPKGLDLNPDILHDKPIPLKVKELPNGWLGVVAVSVRGLTVAEHLAASPDGSVISTFGRGLLDTIISHEGTHVMQNDNAHRAKETLGEDIATPYRRHVFYLASESAAAMREVMELDRRQPGYKSSNLQADRPLAAIGRILQESYQYSTCVPPEKRLHLNFRDCANKLSYFRDGEEVQARLQQAIIDGYQTWGRLPQNKDELWQAMLGFGLTPPPSVAKKLEALPEDAPARRFCTDLTETKHCREMSLGYHSLSDPARELFWEKAMPLLYADLIEMYGDKLGRERFGLGINIRGRLQAAAPGRKGPKSLAI